MIREQLNRCGFGSRNGSETASQVEHLESLIGVRLPGDYRTFLLNVDSGDLGDALANCTQPTPFGEHIMAELFSAANVEDLLDSTVTPRNMICIGYGHFGRTTCLLIAGAGHGHLFSLDTETRHYKWTAEVLKSLPHLAESVREFFRLRDADELPECPWGYENLFHIADSFNEFVGKLYVKQRD